MIIIYYDRYSSEINFKTKWNKTDYLFIRIAQRILYNK